MASHQDGRAEMLIWIGMLAFVIAFTLFVGMMIGPME